MSLVPTPSGGQRGGADRGLPAWALSTVLIHPPLPVSLSGRRVPEVSLPAPSQSQQREICCPLGSLAWLSGLRGFLLPRPRAASLPSPRPAHSPSPPVQGPSPPPLSLPLPSSRSPLQLVRQFRSRCWVFTPGARPGPPLGSPDPPGAPARPPRSLTAADGAATGAGSAEPRAQLAQGRAPPPTQPGRTEGPAGPSLPQVPKVRRPVGVGAAAGGRGVGSSAAQAPAPPRGQERGWAPQRTGGGPDPQAVGRSCPPPPRLRPFLALEESPERPGLHLPPHTSFCLPFPALLSTSLLLLRLHISYLLWESYRSIIRSGHRRKGLGAPVSSYVVQRRPWILSFAEIGGAGIVSGVE